jgi:hypothetical protein
MASTQIQFAEMKHVRADLTVVIPAGETEILLTLPSPVPDGQALVLTITATGQIVDEGKAPANPSVSIGSVSQPVKP